MLPSQPTAFAAHPTDVRTLTRRRLTERHRWAYPLAVRVHQVRRHAAWLTSGASWATRAASTPELPVRVKKHGSLLLRDLSLDEMALQHNKVVNLRLASARTDGVVIRPGETFSFNKVIGNCTRRKGYVVGMRLSNGDATAGVGGGICQLANLLHWMFLHSPLTVVERSEHSFDPFPDKNRVLPWGVGCSIVWNYVDLVVRNDTDVTFQLRTWLDEKHLRGELRADRPVDHSYKVEARRRGLRPGGRPRLASQRDLAQPGRPAHRQRRRRGAGQAQLRDREVPAARAPRHRPDRGRRTGSGDDGSPKHDPGRPGQHRDVLTRVRVVDDEVRGRTLVQGGVRPSHSRAFHEAPPSASSTGMPYDASSATSPAIPPCGSTPPASVPA